MGIPDSSRRFCRAASKFCTGSLRRCDNELTSTTMRDGMVCYAAVSDTPQVIPDVALRSQSVARGAELMRQRGSGAPAPVGLLAATGCGLSAAETAYSA